MRKPRSVRSLEALGRVRLSPSFFMRDFLYSEIAAMHGFQNVPDDPDLAIAAGSLLCEELLEPLQSAFGRISIRSAYRSPQVNAFGNANRLNCAANENNYAGHIWDRLDDAGRMGATACVVVNRFIPHYQETGDWEALAWWVHDHLPYHEMEFDLAARAGPTDLQHDTTASRMAHKARPFKLGRAARRCICRYAGKACLIGEASLTVRQTSGVL
jgi:hypothetical protein